jgi:hypothetical protein
MAFSSGGFIFPFAGLRSWCPALSISTYIMSYESQVFLLLDSVIPSLCVQPNLMAELTFPSVGSILAT